MYIFFKLSNATSHTIEKQKILKMGSRLRKKEILTKSFDTSETSVSNEGFAYQFARNFRNFSILDMLIMN